MKMVSEKEFANIITSIRKRFGKTQAEVAYWLGITQPEYSFIESGKQFLSCTQFILLCEKYQINPSYIVYDYYEFNSKVKMVSDRGEHTFKVPRKYLPRQCFNVRFILPLINYISDKWGQESIKLVLKESGVDPLYFTCRDNQLNLKFLDDFFMIMRANFSMNDEDIFNATNLLSEQRSHGSQISLFDVGKISLLNGNGLSSYIQMYQYYQRVFDSEIRIESNNEFIISDSLNSWLGTFYKKSSPHTKQYFKNLRINGVPKIAERITGNLAKCTCVEISTTNSLETNYRYKIA